jgi:hypothetical protein
MPPKTDLEPIKDSITEQREIIDKHTDQLARVERQLQLLKSRKLFIRRTSSEGTNIFVQSPPTETKSLDKYTLTLVISGVLVIFLLLLYVLDSPREYEEQLWK